METTNFSMYNSLRPKLGDEVAQELVTFIRTSIKSEIMDLTKICLTKEDKFDILGKIEGDKGEVLGTMKDDKVEILRIMNDDTAKMLGMMRDDKIEMLGKMEDDKVQMFKMMKDDKTELMRAVYMTSLFNFIAIAATIIGAVITIVSFIQKN